MKKLTVTSAKKEELIDITEQVRQAASSLKRADGVCTVFTPHTTAAITINENADPDVARDILYGLKKMVPESGYHHTEGNSPAHIKSTLVGCSEQIIVINGELNLGTWQAVFFCEFDGPRTRTVFVA